MEFCRSRILRKKSLLSSLTGFTVGAGAIGGPPGEYSKALYDTVVGAAGCRAMNDGMNMASIVTTSGRTESSCGSRHTKV